LWQQWDDLHRQAHTEITVGPVEFTPETAVGAAVVFYVGMALKFTVWL